MGVVRRRWAGGGAVGGRGAADPPPATTVAPREGGDPAKAKSYLPKDKQYLITRNGGRGARGTEGRAAARGPPTSLPFQPSVPSRRRAAAVTDYGEEMFECGEDGDGEGGWVAPRPDAAARADAVALGGGDAAAAPEPASPPVDDDDDDILPGLEDLEIVAHADAADPAALPPARAPALLATRTYDLRVTYDKYYQVPRLWLAPYGEDRGPLPPAAALDDVSSEHARKTVTVDAWPHGAGAAATVHPCRHAAVVKKLADVAASGPGGARPPVDRFLILFLKMMATVVPTIEYDFTLAAAV